MSYREEMNWWFTDQMLPEDTFPSANIMFKIFVDPICKIGRIDVISNAEGIE